MDNLNDNQFNSNYTMDGAAHHDSWKTMMERLYNDVSHLIAQESVLVRTEVKEKTTEVTKALGSLVIGGAILAVGGMCVAATAIIALNLVLPLWAAALAVTSLFLIVGGIILMAAKKKLSMDRLMPNHSIEAMGHISNTFKERINEFKSYRHH